MYGMLPKRLRSTKLETIRSEACRRFIGILSPKEFNTKPVTDMEVTQRKIPTAEAASPIRAANMAGTMSKKPANCSMKPRLLIIGL
jgi:hypothetical protein